MKKLLLLAMSIFMLTSCENAAKKSPEGIRKDTVQMVGQDHDEHGCSVSGGYTWSKMKKECVQIFNIGFRLNPVENKKGAAVISAFVLTSEDHSVLELFLPDDVQQSRILRKATGQNYEGDGYRYDANRSILYLDGKLIYKGNVE